MRKQNIILTLVLIVCLTIVMIIWLSVRDKIQPVTFPPIVNAEIVVGPLHKKRSLTPSELESVKKWIKSNLKGWGPLHQNPPSTGDVEIQFNRDLDKNYYINKPEHEKPHPFTLVLWLGISQADWNNKIFYEVINENESKIFVKDCNDSAFDPLRKLVDQYDYERTDFP